jgi:hypothetical protein
MAELNARIVVKASGTATEVPSSSDLEVAELAVNTADGKLFTKHTNGSIVTISGGDQSIDDLTDVDTTTSAPTDGQSLVWNNANGQWEPGSPTGGGVVNSVNTQTGTVSLGIQDMDDFALVPISDPSFSYSTVNVYSSGSVSGVYFNDPGEAQVWANGSELRFNEDGDTKTAFFTYAAGNSWTSGQTVTFWLSVSGAAWTEHTATYTADTTNGIARLYSVSPVITEFNGEPNGYSSDTIRVATSDPSVIAGVPLADGDVLQWVDADSTFKPTQLGIDDLSDVDTTTAAPTDGQALVWDSTAGQWEPGTVSGGGSSVPSASSVGGKVLASTGTEWVGADVSTMLAGGNFSPTC